MVQQPLLGLVQLSPDFLSKFHAGICQPCCLIDLIFMAGQGGKW